MNESATTDNLEQLADRIKSTHSTIESMVGTFIQEAVVTGILKPGERIQQDRIADLLGVSRMPVRANLRRLEAEGLLEFHPYRGATVRKLAPTDIAEIFEIRTILETYALRRVVERINADEIAMVEQLVKLVDTESDPTRWLIKRLEFYEHLYSIAGRPRLTAAIMKLRREVGRYWMMMRIDPEGHQELVEAIKLHDVEQAVQWLEEHFAKIAEELQRLISEEQSFQESE